MLAEDKIEWYALRATYGRVLEAKKVLDFDSVENFVPQHYQIFTKKDGHKERKLVPYFKDLIFIHSTSSVVKREKEKIPYLLYITHKEDNKNKPTIVPDQQMQQFIGVIETYNEQLIFLNPEEINLSRGTRVRVHGGQFDNYEGIFVRVKGVRNRRVVVAVEGVAAVALATIDPDFIEPIR